MQIVYHACGIIEYKHDNGNVIDLDLPPLMIEVFKDMRDSGDPDLDDVLRAHHKDREWLDRQ